MRTPSRTPTSRGSKDAGVSEDEIFEQTVATAIAQGLRRLDVAMAVIG